MVPAGACGDAAMIRLVLVDDHELVRTGFKLILGQHSDIQIIGEAASAEEGLRLIRTQNPDVALVDVHMPGMSGIELTERALRSQLPTRIIILTVVSDARFPRRLLEGGAMGYLTKGCATEELLAAIRQVAAGRRYLAPDVAQQLALATLDGGGSPFEQLSARELEVAMMLVRGKPVFRIAEQLHLSPKTVSTYKQRLMTKLEVENLIALAHLMEAYSLIEPRGGLQAAATASA